MFEGSQNAHNLNLMLPQRRYSANNVVMLVRSPALARIGSFARKGIDNKEKELCYRKIAVL